MNTVKPAAPASAGPDRREQVEAFLRRLAPGIPAHEREAATDRALRSPGLSRARPETAAWLALVAYIRHALTEYDDLLEEGYDRDSARFFVVDAINEVLAGWGSPRRVSGEEDEA